MRPFSLTLLVAVCCILAGPRAVSAADCAGLQVSAPKPPADAVSVAQWGAKPNDDVDDARAIQTALGALEAGQTLVFPPGRYLVGSSLRADVPKTTLLGEGAVLHATNPDDQSLTIAADGVSVFGFTLTAVTAGRKSATRHHRIAIYRAPPPGSRDALTVFDTLIAGVKIVPADPGVERLANSGSAAGIFVYRARRFAIVGNLVQRSLADGIHVTGGSRDGVVVGNTVQESGDDMVAMVSYGWSPLRSGPDEASAFLERYDALADRGLVQNVLVANNDLSGNYWGRGISVVGGSNITIRDNRIHDMPVGTGAAVLLARDQGYATFGVENVLIKENHISNLYGAAPAYNPQRRNSLRPLGHGGIELHSFVFSDEAADPALSDKLSVRRILIEGNDVRAVRGTGIRTGVSWTGSRPAKDATGKTVDRLFRSGSVKDVGILDNRFDELSGVPLAIDSAGTLMASMKCAGNLLQGKAAEARGCTGGAPRVSGATLACDLTTSRVLP